MVVINSYGKLANAIIVQACIDYREALYKNYDYEIKLIERFFRSQWFTELTSVSGEYLIRKLKEEIKNGN